MNFQTFVFALFGLLYLFNKTIKSNKEKNPQFGSVRMIIIISDGRINTCFLMRRHFIYQFLTYLMLMINML